jgi:hypothetical protein
MNTADADVAVLTAHGCGAARFGPGRRDRTDRWAQLATQRGIPMTTWTDEELSRIGEAEELNLASTRPDGTLRPYVTMWVVRTGDELYVRSAYGATNPWYRRAKASGVGRIRAGGVERDVTFGEAGGDVHDAVDAAYHAKYDRYGPNIVGTVVGPQAAAVTVRLVPRNEPS